MWSVSSLMIARTPLLFLFFLAVNGQQNCENDQVFSSWSETCEDSMAENCLATEWYDADTNECVKTESWGETRRDIHLHIRQVYNSSSGLVGNITNINNHTNTANNDTDCHHGEYHPQNETCICDDGWQTQVGQDIFNKVWCNQSVYDEEYYGESELRENKQFAYQLFVGLLTISFAATFMIKSITRIAGLCFKEDNTSTKKRKRGKKRRKKKKKKRKKRSHHRKYKTTSRSQVSADEDEEGIEMTRTDRTHQLRYRNHREWLEKENAKGVRITSRSASKKKRQKRRRKRNRSEDDGSNSEEYTPRFRKQRKRRTPRSMPRVERSGSDSESDSDADKLYVRSVEF